MTENSELRRRIASGVIKENGNINHEKQQTKSSQYFKARESTLTTLIESSLHIRAMYHIFVVILIILLLDTVVFDLIEYGKINIGLRVVANGFGDFKRGVRIWLYQFCLALSLYPGLLMFAFGARHLRKSPGILKIWTRLGVAGVVTLQAALIGIPTWQLANKHLAVASAISVTCEMFRFAMKIHAVTMACAPRCLDERKPLPTFKHYLYFLFAPTLVYRDQYPRTKKTRWSVVAFHFSEVAAIVFYDSFLWERFILPYWSDYGKQTQVEASYVVRGMFGCILPGMLSFLCGFYCLLHAWMNAFAEMLTFADKQFYEEWWTKSQFSHYYRSWNLVVYSWLRDHIYKPLAPRMGRGTATLIVFLVSSIAHEVVLALSFGFFYPVLLVEFGVLGLIFVPLTAKSGRRFPNVFNVIMWLSFFIGNGLLWSLYPMEYFARQNCPASDNDRFYIPKSWTCPSVVLKPDWSFQNPINIIL